MSPEDYAMGKNWKLVRCMMRQRMSDRLITRLNVPHYHGCMVCLNGKLFVLCGRNERN